MPNPVEVRREMGPTAVVPKTPEARVGVNPVVAERRPVVGKEMVVPTMDLKAVETPIMGVGPTAPVPQERRRPTSGKGI